MNLDSYCKVISEIHGALFTEKEFSKRYFGNVKPTTAISNVLKTSPAKQHSSTCGMHCEATVAC
jgi:hypothetical protein